jgi:signal transduction histidine kinase
MKLSSQYNRIALLIMVTFLLLSSLVYYFLMNYLILRELDLNLTKIQKRVISYVAENRSFPVVQPLDDLRISYTPAAGPGIAPKFRLIDPSGRPGANPHSVRELSFNLSLDHKWYSVVITRNLEGTDSFAKLVVKSAVIIILIVIVAFLLVNRIALRKLWQPFYASIAKIESFQLGKEGKIQFPKARIDEFNFLNSHLEKMAARVQNEYIILREFTQNASHEMQTPLAIIRSKLDLTIQDQDLSEEQSANLKSAYAAIKKLSNLNRSLLLLAKIENNQFSENTPLNLKNKLEEKIAQFQELWKHKTNISYEIEEATIYANSYLLELLLNNLLSNAIKHNVQHGRIFIELKCRSLIITNTGSPFPLDQTRLFKRFYKESPDSDHNGLGLSIVKQICDLSDISIFYAFDKGMHSFILEWREAAPAPAHRYLQTVNS